MAQKDETMAAPKTDSLMMALGTPAKPMGPKGPKDSSYLASKPPELRSYLEDAVDPTLDPQQRAEALCKAIEFQSGESEPDSDDTGGDGQSDYGGED